MGYMNCHNTKEIFISILVPSLVQTLVQKCTMPIGMEMEENLKEYETLMDHFIGNLISYNLHYDSELINMKKQKEKDIGSYEDKLSEANRKLNEYLTSPIYIQLMNLQQLYDQLFKNISEVAEKILNLSREYEEIESSEEVGSLNHEKRKYSHITSLYEGLDKKVLLAYKEELESDIRDLKNKDIQLRKYKRDTENAIEKAKTGTCSHYYTLQLEIERIKSEKETLLEKYEFAIKNFYINHCVNNGWLVLNEELNAHNLTAAGAVRFLELLGYLKKF